MSARDELDAFLDCQGLSPMGRQKAQWFMADYAHELSDLIRDEAWPHERDERENRLIHELADKIDPEVEK